MKSFKQYLAEQEQLSQVSEDSNLPAAVDSTSPISGKQHDDPFIKNLSRKLLKSKSNETVSVHRKSKSSARDS